MQTIGSIEVLSRTACCVPAWHGQHHICFTKVPGCFGRPALRFSRIPGCQTPPGLIDRRSQEGREGRRRGYLVSELSAHPEEDAFHRARARTFPLLAAACSAPRSQVRTLARAAHVHPSPRRFSQACPDRGSATASVLPWLTSSNARDGDLHACWWPTDSTVPSRAAADPD